MKLEKLLWSKTKVDILKYLVFKRQWISIRALENELSWSFPAIKKQVDLLCDADVLKIDKEWAWWSIRLEQWAQDIVRNLFLFSMEWMLNTIVDSSGWIIKHTYLWRIFGKPLDMDVDLVLIYETDKKEEVALLKSQIESVFKDYFIDVVSVVFLSYDDFQKRYRVADKFVLNLIRYNK